MDVDGNKGQEAPSGSDIDTSFLQQFSCLGTTDHDELVRQLQKILGDQLNYANARFFLEMNNWNLQAAVGCYFDFNAGQHKLPSMKIVADITVGEGEAVAPNSRFVQSWRLLNTGSEEWPIGCVLKCTTNPDETDLTLNSALPPGQTIDLSIDLTSPMECGSFQRKYRMYTPHGQLFGESLWMMVTVNESGTLALTQQLSALQTTNGGESAPTMMNPTQQPLLITPYMGQLVGPVNFVDPGPNVAQQTQTMEALQQPHPDDADMC